MRISVIDNSSSKIWKSCAADKQPWCDIHTHTHMICHKIDVVMYIIVRTSFFFSRFSVDFFSFFLRLGLILQHTGIRAFAPNVVVYSWESSVMHVACGESEFIVSNGFSLSLIPPIYVISFSFFSFLSRNYFIWEVMCVTLPICYPVTSLKKNNELRWTLLIFFHNFVAYGY